MKLTDNLTILVLGLVLLAAAACQETMVVRQKAPPPPPPWASGHGSRVTHRYHYYPESAVYEDTARKLFFYYDGERWATTTLLPARIQVDWKRYVVLDMGTDKPYRYHSDVARKYPPGRGKKREKTRAEKE